MSKFKIGDKVRVKYIPGITDDCQDETFHQHPDLQGEKEIEWISPSGFTVKLQDDPNDFWFCEESLEFLNTSSTTQRTLLGLETELHSVRQQIEELTDKLWKIRVEVDRIESREE